MKSLIDFALGHSRTILFALGIILVAGAVTYITVPKEAQPEVEIPVIYVHINHDGISPEDSERLLIRPLEQELRGLDALREIRATAMEGGASIFMEFEAGVVDTQRALQDVRDRVDTVRPELPDDSDEPTVREIELTREDPMLILNLAGPVDERSLVSMARRLKEDIEGVSGVLEVDLFGDREELAEITVDPMLMDSHGINQDELVQLVSRNNRLVAAGAWEGESGRFPVKVPGVFEDIEDVMDMPVKVEEDRVVRFQDIGQGRRTYKDPDSFARLNGDKAIGLEVIQRAGSNVVDSVAEIQSIVAAHQEEWPEAMQVVYTRDQSRDIAMMLGDLQNNVLSAVLLVVIVIIAVMGLRSAGLVAVAIPGSFLAGMLLLGLFGFTINIIVLFSLIMAVGLLVDAAIIVTEFADRKMAEGMRRREAYRAAAHRMAWPITAATATTVAAFVPLLFWPGVAGDFMRFLPLTLIAVLLSSLAMALIFIPTLGSLIGKPGALTERGRANLAAAETGSLDDVSGPTHRYLGLLAWCLRRPLRVVSSVLVFIVAIFVAYGYWGQGTEFFPQVEPEFGFVDIHARGDLSIHEQDRLVREVERRLEGMPEIESRYVRTGSASMAGASGDDIGRITLQLADWDERRRIARIFDEIRERTADLAGIRVETTAPRAGPGEGKPIQLRLASRDSAALEEATERVRRHMEEMEALEDIEDDRPLPGIEWRLRVDREQAARFGADVTDTGNIVQMVTQGLMLGDFRPDDAEEEVEIRVRYPAVYRDLDRLDQLQVNTDRGQVPVSTFVTREPGPRTGTIQRTNLQRTFTVEADVREGFLVSDQVNRLRGALADMELGPAVQAEFAGEEREAQEAEAFLGRAMIAAVFLILLILVTQFNSFYQAGLILTAILLSTGGVLLGHLLTQQPFGIIMSGVGVIALAGIVVNNNIVLIDTFNILRRKGMTAEEAVLRTGAQRLRPVILTAVTTILGLMPMVLGINIDLFGRELSLGAPSAQWWIQLSSAVAGGLAFATVLTLIVTPSLLMLQGGMEERRAERRLERTRTRQLEVHP